MFSNVELVALMLKKWISVKSWGQKLDCYNLEVDGKDEVEPADKFHRKGQQRESRSERKSHY